MTASSYLESVKHLETNSQRLESKVLEHLEKKGPEAGDITSRPLRTWGLRSLQSCRQCPPHCKLRTPLIASDDFRVKYETQLAMCQSVESDISEL